MCRVGWQLPAGGRPRGLVQGRRRRRQKVAELWERLFLRSVVSNRMDGPHDTDKWYGRWYVPVLVVAVAFAIVMAIAQRAGEAARTRLSTSSDNRFPVARGTGCEPGIGC